MKKINLNTKRAVQRKNRVKGKIYRGGISFPRLSVSKTNKHIFLQVIDDIKKITLVSASDKDIKNKEKGKIELATELGKIIAKKSLEKDIKQIVFDRNKYSYHGVVKAIADGAREGGLKF